MMRAIAFASTILVSACAAYPPMGANRLAGGETIIPFAANGGIVDWHATNNQSIYLRDRAGHWYYVTLAAPCPNLPFNPNISFSTDASGNFDRFSTIITPNYRCSVQSIVRSETPVGKGGRG